MPQDNLTHEQALEKARWIDKLRELGFVWNGNIDDQPNLSKWRHTKIQHLTARLALTPEGRFVAMLCIELSHVMHPDIHLGAESPEHLQDIYEVVTSEPEEE